MLSARKMCLIVILLSVITFLSGCNTVEKKSSDNILTEGVVVSANFEAAYTDTPVTTINAGGMPLGGDLYVTNVSEPDTYQTTLSWKYGPIILEDAENYNKFKGHIGAKIIITYCDIYYAIYDGKTGNLISRKTIDHQIKSIALKQLSNHRQKTTNVVFFNIYL